LKAVWTLCQNLWGDIPDGYKSNPNELNMGNHELEQIRKRLLSEWLTDMSAHRIEKECKMNKFNKVGFFLFILYYYIEINIFFFVEE
jgi:hypothetical protein